MKMPVMIIATLAYMLSACSTIEPKALMTEELSMPSSTIEIPAEPVLVVSEEVSSPAVMMSAPMDSQIVEFEQATRTAALTESVERIPAKKKSKVAEVAGKVLDTVISSAAAAATGTKTTVTYDGEGKVKDKVVVNDKDSIIGILTKIVGLLTATFGLYVSYKKFRTPATVTT